MQQRVINLDSIKTQSPIVIVLNEKRHEMKPATVQTFVDNMKLIESLGTEPSVLKEIEVAMIIIGRAFPTITEDELKELPFDALQQISEFARGANEEIATTNEAEAASGNAQKAS